MTDHVIVYSHGFGVRKDGRGLFTDIAATMPKTKHILFDYNIANDATNTLTVASLPDQVEKLEAVIKRAQAEHPGAVIDIIAHSMGCVVAAISRPSGIRKTIFLAPPSKLDAEQFATFFKGRPGSDIDLTGTSRLARRDGSTTVVPAEYWRSLTRPQPIRLYNQLSKETELTIVEAGRDEVLGSTNFDTLDSQIKIELADADHDFSGASRGTVIDLIKTRLIYD